MSEVQIVEAHPGTPGNSLGHDPIPENKGIERKRGEEIKIKRPPYMFFYTTVRNHRTLFFKIKRTIWIITGRFLNGYQNTLHVMFGTLHYLFTINFFWALI